MCSSSSSCPPWSSFCLISLFWGVGPPQWDGGGALSLLVLADWVALGGGGGVSLRDQPEEEGLAHIKTSPAVQGMSRIRPRDPLRPQVSFLWCKRLGETLTRGGGVKHPCSPLFLGIKSGEEERSPPGSPFSSISLVYTSSPPLFLFLFLGPTAHGRAARSQRKEKEKPSSSSSWQNERRKKSLRRNSLATSTPQ